MYFRLYEFPGKHDCLYNKQFGFRNSHSANYVFITITEIIKETLGKDEYACEECLDIQKVFETVNHEILFDKLAQFCLRRLNLNWFQSYLTNRKHKTL